MVIFGADGAGPPSDVTIVVGGSDELIESPLFLACSGD
jgi:hypothetical protein